MARVFISSVKPACDAKVGETLASLQARMSALAAKCREHRLVDDPAEADVVLLDASFTLFFSHLDRARLSIRRDPLRRAHPEKCFVFDPDDDPCLLVPGVFASLDLRRWDRRRHRAGPYLHHLGNTLLDPRCPVREARHLCSFVGAPSTHPVRKRLLETPSLRGLIIATDAHWPQDEAGRQAFRNQYADAIHGSRFVLCPRGRGTSSTRLFEVLQAGRVPVIIADHWVAPAGPDWDRFSIRIAEDQLPSITERLERLEPDVEEMAQAARRAFEEWFSEERTFGRVIDSCLELKSLGACEPLGSGRLAREMCRPNALKRFVLKPMIDRLRSRARG